ncbi:protein asteroid homolog 1-like protein [Lates japonicus]|uniref:Protein asteroid homolog 1-like protein n=1 Tax=Lates japonicus TaxID=270547 RepID=A0AAD3N5U4_LATJO|nr:protein asteroid homolog 1-like protein [Lates japonicus]
MGVQGLTTYVEGNRQFLQDVKFRDSRLVIDGCSLYFRLYFTHGLDQQHGGDYDAFARLLIQFLSALAACNVQPFVVLDGGMDPSDKKFATLRQRLQSKIKEADNISHGRNGSVLPILTRDVFIQVLIQRGVPLVQCPAEADWEIACLAHQWNCPVLTNDSDFYIFDLPGGYMPLSFFQWTNLSGKASHRYISARCYTASSLCHWFGGMNRELLPLCAVLIGNDYGTPKDAETLLALIDVSTLGRGGARGRGRAPSSRIEGLLIWLSSFSSPAEALGEVSRLMGEDGGGGKRGQRGGLSSQLWAGMQEYHITPQSSLARWFSGGKAAPAGRTSGLAQLPGYLSQAAAQGLLAPLVVDALVMRRVLLVPQEYDRLDLNLKKNQVDAHPPRTPICLDTLGQAPVAVCLGVLYEVLGVKESSLAAVPPHLRLAVAVTGFWLREATPTPSQLLLQALVLGIVYGELSWNNQPGATHYQYAVPQINWAAERNVWAGLDRQRVRPGERRGLDVGAAHSFSQWQACLWSAQCLNQLLLLPLPEIHLSWLFSGTLVHGLIRYLKGGRAAESLLAGGSLSGQLYSSLLDAVRSCSSKAHPSASSAAGRGRRGRGRGRRGRRGGGRGARGGRQGTEEINNRFALLMSEEESDDDW